MDNQRFRPEVEMELRKAGWHSGRAVTDFVDEIDRTLSKSDSLKMPGTVRAVLLEFGALRVEQHGKGVSAARESFVIDPALATGERDRFERFELQSNLNLYPLGEGGNGHFFLALGIDGHTYLVMDDIIDFADTFDEALNKLILGIR